MQDSRAICKRWGSYTKQNQTASEAVCSQTHHFHALCSSATLNAHYHQSQSFFQIFTKKTQTNQPRKAACSWILQCKRVVCFLITEQLSIIILLLLTKQGSLAPPSFAWALPRFSWQAAPLVISCVWYCWDWQGSSRWLSDIFTFLFVNINTVHTHSTNGRLTERNRGSQHRDFWDDICTVRCAVLVKAVLAMALGRTVLTK